MKWQDAHAHIGSEAELKGRQHYAIRTLMNVATPEEGEQLQPYIKETNWLVISAGVHPWQADQVRIESLLPFIEACQVVGEIGMDSVWCDVDLAIQEAVFVQQLELAKALEKPVILHTKGQEARIIELINQYQMPVLVHWYGELEHLAEYMARDCYFTVGPDFDKSAVTKELIRCVPLSRLLVETDGLGAVEWALDRKVEVRELPRLLEEAMQAIAQVKGISLEEVKGALEANWYRFIGPLD